MRRLKNRGSPRHLIFISYRRSGAAGYAGRVYDALNSARRFRGRVFLDVYSIEPTEDFVEALRRAAESCRVMLVLIDGQWLGRDEGGAPRLNDPNDFVRREVEAALRRGIAVLPVRIDDAPMPRPEELPPSLRGLANRQAVALRHDQWPEGMGLLTAALEKAVGSPLRAFAVKLLNAVLIFFSLFSPSGFLIGFWANRVASYYIAEGSPEAIATDPSVSTQLIALQALSVSLYFCVWLAIYKRLRRRPAGENLSAPHAGDAGVGATEGAGQTSNRPGGRV